MSLRARKKLATRNALINTARRLFVEKGYENTTLEEICNEVQIHVTTFFSYFDSKEELAFARTIEMLESFRELMRKPPPGQDVMSLWWKFFYDFALYAGGVEGTIMMRMDSVPALRNRYANIVRQYEEELAAALAREAGNDPAKDLYSQLVAATTLSTVVSAARWYNHNFDVGGDGRADIAVFSKTILSEFPDREQIEREMRSLAAARVEPAVKKSVRRKSSSR
jgi:AcrR family transcriptional regulator